MKKMKRKEANIPCLCILNMMYYILVDGRAQGVVKQTQAQISEGGSGNGLVVMKMCLMINDWENSK